MSQLRCFPYFRLLRNGSLAFLVLLVLLITKSDNFFQVKKNIHRPRHPSAVTTVVQGHFSPIKSSGNGGTIDGSNSRSIKLLCYLLISRSSVKAAKIVRETWGSHCDKLLFFGGFNYPELGVIQLNVTEGYENLWGKSRAAVQFLSEHPVYKLFDYYLKADDDTFVIVENLKRFIKESEGNLKEPAWFGFKLKHRKMLQGYMSGGAGYVFNNAALQKISKLFKTMRSNHSAARPSPGCNIDGEYGVEDLELGKCFLSAGVKSVETTEKDGRERFLPLPYETYLNGGIPSYHWIWNQAWNRVRTGERCCSKSLISMHEVTPTQIRTIYNLLHQIKLR